MVMEHTESADDTDTDAVAEAPFTVTAPVPYAPGGGPLRNPFPPIVPCHRVLAAGRQVGGFSARGGRRTKLRMLEAEGVHLEHPTLFDV